MIQQLKNIDTAFKHIRLFTLVLIIGTLSSMCYCFYYCIQEVEKAQSRIYIISNGKALEAFSSNRKDNLSVEARDHVRTFHEYFFNLSPDDKAIQATITKALYLSDESAMEQYNDLKEKSYFNNIISANISQEVTCDSVILNMEQYPYYFRFSGHLKIIRRSSIVTRSLITEGTLRNVDRSDNNSHGFLIEGWNIIENKDLSTQKR